MEAMTLTQRSINDLMAQGYFSEIPLYEQGLLKDLWIDEMKNRGWDIGVTGDGNDYDLAHRIITNSLGIVYQVENPGDVLKLMKTL